MKIIVAQIGPREHYAAAQSLYQQGLLAGLITDWYAFNRKNPAALGSLMAWFLKHLGGLGRSALAARCEGLPDDLVHAFPFRSLYWKWQVRRLSRQGRSHEAYLKTDRAFAAAVGKLHLPPHQALFGYSYASLEILQLARATKTFTILNQIDPGPMEFRLVSEEMTRNPGLAGLPQPFPSAYYDRVRQEWALADVVIVNSEWSRDALISEGVEPAKIEILPLAYEPAQSKENGDRRSHAVPGQALRVLWLGQVNVRKGIHYLLEAARLLEGENIQFDIVGPGNLLSTALAGVARGVRFHGAVSRDRAGQWYGQADVFVLPTLSDGFALTQLEALSHGLPVVATPNCGRVVESGKTGFIVPARDAAALAAALRLFVHDRALAPSMAPACRAAVRSYSLDAYGKRLVEIIRKRREAPSAKRQALSGKRQALSGKR